MSLGGSALNKGLAALLLGWVVSIAPGSALAGICDTPVWQDEFSGAELDGTRWSHAQGDGCAQGICGWGNDEEQWYSPDNAFVKDGVLHIVAKQQRKGERAYTSAKITTENHFAQKYGRFEARMQLPLGKGYWPAFWLMPADARKKWPLEGEIDILENSGHEPHRVLGAIHFGDTWPDNVHYSESILTPVIWGEDFHTYAVEWVPGEIRWYVDDKQYGSVTPEEILPHPWVFEDKAFFLILNLALGGTLGKEIDKEALPGELLVDYVRVYAGNCTD